ncbi:MAG TPA: alpha/beta hydrolase [Candidatus Saccharimonadales bacterium]|nr:alpha/beta hydrolase [Candidatus Saccharimonadales bacterium]
MTFEYAFSLLVLSRPRKVFVASYDGLLNVRTSILLPGFSNPPAPLGRGMQTILGRYGPMLVLHHSTTVVFDRIYEALMAKLGEMMEQGAPRKLTIYGHSMGGQLGELFRERYEREGSIYGPICEMFLDCTPSNEASLPAPKWLRSTLKVAFRFYWGGPMLALIVALGNYISRFTVPAPRDTTVDAALYQRYASGLMWYNNRAWVAQMRFMLNYVPPAEPVNTDARVTYIGAKDPSRDGLVLQKVAIPDWQRVYPGMLLILDDAVGHAWPMEQPMAYTRIVDSVLVPV